MSFKEHQNLEKSQVSIAEVFFLKKVKKVEKLEKLEKLEKQKNEKRMQQNWWKRKRKLDNWLYFVLFLKHLLPFAWQKHWQIGTFLEPNCF